MFALYLALSPDSPFATDPPPPPTIQSGEITNETDYVPLDTPQPDRGWLNWNGGRIFDPVLVGYLPIVTQESAVSPSSPDSPDSTGSTDATDSTGSSFDSERVDLDADLWCGDLVDRVWDLLFLPALSCWTCLRSSATSLTRTSRAELGLAALVEATDGEGAANSCMRSAKSAKSSMVAVGGWPASTVWIP